MFKTDAIFFSKDFWERDLEIEKNFSEGYATVKRSVR